MPSFLAKACHYWPFDFKFNFVFVGLFELGVSRKYNRLLTKSTSTEDGPVVVGGFLFKHREIGGYCKDASAGERSYGRSSACFGRLVSCLRAATRPGCMSVLVAHQEWQEQRNTLRALLYNPSSGFCCQGEC